MNRPPNVLFCSLCAWLIPALPLDALSATVDSRWCRQPEVTQLLELVDPRTPSVGAGGGERRAYQYQGRTQEPKGDQPDVSGILHGFSMGNEPDFHAPYLFSLASRAP